MAAFYDEEQDHTGDSSDPYYHQSNYPGYPAQSDTYEDSNETYNSSTTPRTVSYGSGSYGQQPSNIQPYDSSNTYTETFTNESGGYGQQPTYAQSYESSREQKYTPTPWKAEGGPCTCGRGCAENSGCRDGGNSRKRWDGTTDTCTCYNNCARNTGCRIRGQDSSQSSINMHASSKSSVHTSSSRKSSSGKKKSHH